MDAAHKQRLIGAIVLVVLAVIFLPMLLQEQKEKAIKSQAIDLTIPPQPPSHFESRVIPLKPEPENQSAALPPADSIATVVVQSEKPQDAMPELATTIEEPPARKPTEAATPPLPQETVALQNQTPAPQGRFFVSFGSYAKPQNAQDLVAELKKLQIDAYAEAVDLNGQPGLRVRAGPFAERIKAEEARLVARKGKPDLTPAIVEVDAGEAAPAVAQTPEGAAGHKPLQSWDVQVGAFQTEVDANAKRDGLRKAGFAAFSDRITTEKGVLYRVRVGPETARANAERLKATLKSRFQYDAIVVNHD